MTDLARIAASSDIEELAAMMAEDYAEAGYEYDPRVARNAFRQLIADPALGRVWVLCRDHRVAGYIVLTLGYSMEYGGRDAFVDDLFVRKEFRRSGIGRLGLDTLIAECRQNSVRAIHLEVERRNTAAKKLYAAYRFGDTDRHLLTLRLISAHGTESQGAAPAAQKSPLPSLHRRGKSRK